MKSEGRGDEADQGDIPEADKNFAPSERKLDAAALVEKYRPFLKTIAAAEFPDLLKTRIDASDIVQDTLLRAHQQLSQFQGTTEAELQGWLRGILRHLLTDAVRFNKRQRRDIQRDGRMPEIDPSCVDDTPSEQVRKRESWDAIWQAVSALPEDYRTVILMHHQYNLSFADIGERLQKSPDAVRMLWGRAIVVLASRLKNHR
ncbi:MAG: sigma-70 family RNA polymerase sigma factor [Planctomyces sp.]|nr:sigma-70 family RNA polymerase sigma factor [Planctomyces sp.]